MDENTKLMVMALVESVLAVDLNPQYKVSDADYNKVKAAKHRAMALKALMGPQGSVIDDEVTDNVALIGGYRVADVNAAIAKYNAAQSKFVVRAVTPGEVKVKSAPAPRSWLAAFDTFRTLFGLRRPDEPDYKAIL